MRISTTKQIAALPVWQGATQARVGDVFDVRGERAACIEIEGDLDQACFVGARHDRRAARTSTAASATTPGRRCRGGVLRVDGHAGDRLGGAAPGAAKRHDRRRDRGVRSAGESAGALMRRGLVAVAGGVGAYAGRGMIAGTLLALGPVGELPGAGNKRGSIVAAGGVAVPASYRFACSYEPPHVRLLLTSLRRRFGFPCDPGLLAGRFDRYCGDAGEPGKGEILVWTGYRNGDERTG